MENNTLIVSACLAGFNCRYDGTAKPCGAVVKLVQEGRAVPVCLEQLGGLPTPRLPAEIRGNHVYRKDGVEVTTQFQLGAQECLKLANLLGVKSAILKSKSPSCGVNQIYDGSFEGKLIEGDGVTAALLRANGIDLKTEEDINSF